jgi:hypothetical protein
MNVAAVDSRGLWGGSFEVSYVDAAGAAHRGVLGELWDVAFERVAQARRFPSYRGQRNFTGSYLAATSGATVGFESWVERDVAMQLDFDPAVVGFASQPFALWWRSGRRERRHVPDYFARLADGTGLVVDVRPDSLVRPEDEVVFAVTEAACAEVGWEFWRTAGPGSVFTANLHWLAGYRWPRCFRPDIAERLVEVFDKPSPLMAGACRVGDRIAVLPVLYHLLWRHVLDAADLRETVLGPGTVVCVSGRMVEAR